MGRPLRIDNAGTWYHVVNRGVARQNIYFDVRDRVEFERLLGVVSDRFGIRVHAFCQMSNHYHLVIECPDGGLSDAMHLLGSVFVRHVNERQGRDGPLFRDRFYAKPICSDAYLRKVVRYVHRNPLAFQTVDQLSSYRWSSFRIYLGHRRAPRWMTIGTVLSMFEDVASFDRFVTADAAGAGDRIGPQAWSAAIDLMIDERFEGPAQGVGRTIAVLLLDRLEGADRDDVAASLTFPSPSAERMARSRARRRLADQPELGAVLAAVVDLAA